MEKRPSADSTKGQLGRVELPSLTALSKQLLARSDLGKIFLEKTKGGVSGCASK